MPDDEPVPESPADAGLPEDDVATVESVEPIHLLANDARAELEADGFTDAQILKWAEAFFREHTEGGVHEFVAWIREQEQ